MNAAICVTNVTELLFRLQDRHFGRIRKKAPLWEPFVLDKFEVKQTLALVSFAVPIRDAVFRQPLLVLVNLPRER